MFSTKPSVVSLLWVKKRSGPLSKSVGATAGNHNLRPLSNHTNYTLLCLVVSERASDWVSVSPLPFFVSRCLYPATRVCIDAFGSMSTHVLMLCVFVPCAWRCQRQCARALFMCPYVYCKWPCNHCHTWPFVLPGGLVCWLVPALPFRQVLLPYT